MIQKRKRKNINTKAHEEPQALQGVKRVLKKLFFSVCSMIFSRRSSTTSAEKSPVDVVVAAVKSCGKSKQLLRTLREAEKKAGNTQQPVRGTSCLRRETRLVPNFPIFLGHQSFAASSCTLPNTPAGNALPGKGS